MISANLTVARPYAKAAFELAQSAGDFEAWSARLQLAAAVVSVPEVIAFLQHPKITPDQMVELLTDVCQSTLDDQGRHFIKLLSANRRLLLLPSIASEFEMYRREAEKVTPVTVTTAFPLSEAQLQALTAALTKRVGGHIELESIVSRDVIGGAVIRMGDRVIDGSLRGKLNNLAIAVAS